MCDGMFPLEIRRRELIESDSRESRHPTGYLIPGEDEREGCRMDFTSNELRRVVGVDSNRKKNSLPVFRCIRVEMSGFLLISMMQVSRKWIFDF